MADKSHLFQPGNPGKPKGAVSQYKTSVKEAVLLAFQKLQESEEHNLVAWGADNPTEFYKIAAKLIPTEVKATVEREHVTINLIKADVGSLEAQDGTISPESINTSTEAVTVLNRL